MRQALQTLRGLQGIAENGNPGITGFLQAGAHRLVVSVTAVEGDSRCGGKLMLFCPAANLVVAQRAQPGGREVKRSGLVPGGGAQRLRPAVIKRTGTGIDRRAVLFLKLSQCERMGHISGHARE